MDRERSHLKTALNKKPSLEAHTYRGITYSIKIMEHPPGYQIFIDGNLTRDVRDDDFRSVDLNEIFQIAHAHAKKLLDAKLSLPQFKNFADGYLSPNSN